MKGVSKNGLRTSFFSVLPLIYSCPNDPVTLGKKKKGEKGLILFLIKHFLLSTRSYRVGSPDLVNHRKIKQKFRWGAFNAFSKGWCEYGILTPHLYSTGLGFNCFISALLLYPLAFIGLPFYFLDRFHRKMCAFLHNIGRMGKSSSTICSQTPVNLFFNN